MKSTRTIRNLSVIAASLLVANMAQAALHDQGNGMIYDDVLNITWQQNANLAASNTFGVSGINTDGTMNWTTAQSWITAMNAANYLGYHDWRLPKLTPVNGVVFQYENSDVGATDLGQNNSGTNSELGYMFYVNLGNQGDCDVNGLPLGCGDLDAVTPLNNVGPFSNLDINNPPSLWTGSPSPLQRIDDDTGLPDGPEAWAFHFWDGGQDPNTYTDQLSVWAVRPVPEPETYALMLAGLGLVGFAARKRTAA